MNIKKLTAMTCTLLIAFCALATPAYAATVAIHPAAEGTGRDTPVLDGIFDAIVGPFGANFLNNELRPGGGGSQGLPDPYEERTAMEFPIGSLAGTTVTSAILSLQQNGRGGTPLVSFYGYAADGLITLPDFTLASQILIATVQTSTDNTMNNLLLGSIDVTSLVQSAVASSQSHAGFLSTVNFGSMGFVSSAAPSINAVRPVLTVQTVPVPAAAWLFASGLLGLVGLSRRKQTS